MRPVDGAGPRRKRRCEDFVHVKEAQAGQRPHDVDDGVDSTDIMKVDGLYSLAMDPGFCLS